jgi:hypothetical protein
MWREERESNRRTRKLHNKEHHDRRLGVNIFLALSFQSFFFHDLPLELQTMFYTHMKDKKQ